MTTIPIPPSSVAAEAAALPESRPGVARTLVAVVLAALFLYAGIEKILRPAGFAQDILNYRMLPLWAVNGWALLLPWWEVLAAVALLSPRWRRAGAWTILLMGIMFVVAVSQALARNLDISCGCFGHTANAAKAGFQTLAIDAGVILGSAYLLRSRGDIR